MNEQEAHHQLQRRKRFNQYQAANLRDQINEYNQAIIEEEATIEECSTSNVVHSPRKSERSTTLTTYNPIAASNLSQYMKNTT